MYQRVKSASTESNRPLMRMQSLCVLCESLKKVPIVIEQRTDQCDSKCNLKSLYVIQLLQILFISKFVMQAGTLQGRPLGKPQSSAWLL